MTKQNCDCVFLLADKQMEYTFRGFLEREDFHQRLGTRSFTFEMAVDYQGNDPGVFTRGHEFLRLFCHTHEHAVVVLDRDWRGAPSAVNIQTKIKRNLVQNGWHEANVEVVVIEPELEIWLWKDGPYLVDIIKKKFGQEVNYQPYPSLRKWLEAQGLWGSTDPKPARPKEAFQLVARRAGVPLSSSDIYRIIAQQVSVRNCVDPAFCLLRETLQRWFPL